MEALALHLIKPLLSKPEAVQLQVIEEDGVTILEAIVDRADRDMLEDDGGRTLRSIRNILSAAAGRTKATLELVESFSEGSSEE